MTAEILSEYGYQRYEISNYAKEGYACRHNMGYWERKEYLGIGSWVPPPLLAGADITIRVIFDPIYKKYRRKRT